MVFLEWSIIMRGPCVFGSRGPRKFLRPSPGRSSRIRHRNALTELEGFERRRIGTRQVPRVACVSAAPRTRSFRDHVTKKRRALGTTDWSSLMQSEKCAAVAVRRMGKIFLPDFFSEVPCNNDRRTFSEHVHVIKITATCCKVLASYYLRLFPCHTMLPTQKLFPLFSPSFV